MRDATSSRQLACWLLPCGLLACGRTPSTSHDAAAAGDASDSTSANDTSDASDALAALPSVAFPHPTNRDVDVLFVIDDAPGSAAAQANLVAAFKTFTATLAARPGGLPNLHLGVVSSDLGAGPSNGPGCTPGGDRGVLHLVPSDSCPALATGERFLSNVDGVANYDTNHDLAQLFPCLAALGDQGCGFRHPFASALRALGADGAPAPPENAGFLRPNAFLSVVLLTTGDDCSAPPDSTLFDATSEYVSDPLGPLTSFRCAEFGLLCGGTPPPRTTAGPLAGCQSTEDGRLLRVSDVVAKLKAIKADANTILIGSISGPPTPYAVVLAPPGLPADPWPWPAVSPSCTSADGATRATPGVRVEQWVYAFGHNGVLEQVCADDLAPALQDIARGIGDVLGPPCLIARLALKMGPHGARPDCTITDHTTTNGVDVDTPLPSYLDDGDVAPCWTLTDDPQCANGRLLGFETPPGEVPVGVDSSVECFVCDDATDPRCI
jgi:hypothetical protein